MHCNQYLPSKFGIDIQQDVHKHIQVVRIVQCDKKKQFLNKKWQILRFFEIAVIATI